LNLPPNGFLNLHPSLLPLLRGPYPLFWTFHLGIQAGITLHFMDEGLDTGDIVAQKTIEFPDGINGAQADLLMAKAGTSLLVTACRQLEKGSLNKIPQQGESSTYPKPLEEDFSIPTSWSARRAFNFIRGTEEWGRCYPIKGVDFDFKVRTAVSYDPKSTLPRPFQKNGADMWISFTPGTLHARQ
jgi:methionyl-tRNA formyltransferase